jgi:transposase
MKIDISNTSAEVESFHQIIASLQNKNEEWSSKYKKLEQEKSKLSANQINLSTRYTELEDNNNKLLQKNTELSNYIALLEERLRLLKAKRFGKSSEKLERQIDVVERLLEEEESLLGFNLKPGAVSKENTQEKCKAKRKKMPAHLPREEVFLEPEAKCDSCGGDTFRKIGEDVSEILERIPESYKVIKYIRPRCACTNCDNIVQAYTPSKVIDKGIAGPGLLADIFVNKFSNHLPAYRQSQMFEREGIDISRSTISSWLGQGAKLLEPIADLIREYVISCNQIHGDDTPVKVLNPGTKKTKTGRMWVYVNDGRPRGDDSPIAAGYYYSPDRTGARPEEHLKDFTGILHADAYAGYNNLYKSEENPDATVEEVCCWAHVRRKFYDIVASNDKANIANRIIDKIGKIYYIESTVRGMSSDVRLKTRKEKSAKLVNELFTGFKKAYKQLPKKSSTAKAIAYALNNEVALRRFLGNGNIEIDNNAAERALRSVAVGRKNWLFAGSDKGGKTAAIIYTILETAKLNNVNPVKYLHKVFDIIQDYKANKLENLLPWNIKLE